jgi:hypothetical protein
MARIYLSYSRKDIEFALKLADRLRSNGHEISIDIESLSPGEDWRRALSVGLKNSDVFVVLLSENSKTSQYMLHEIGAARAYSAESDRMLVVPVAIDDIDIPITLQDVQVLFSPDRDLNNVVAVTLPR